MAAPWSESALTLTPLTLVLIDVLGNRTRSGTGAYNDEVAPRRARRSPLARHLAQTIVCLIAGEPEPPHPGSDVVHIVVRASA
jgi:hypothetical protein